MSMRVSLDSTLLIRSRQAAMLRLLVVILSVSVLVLLSEFRRSRPRDHQALISSFISSSSPPLFCFKRTTSMAGIRTRLRLDNEIDINFVSDGLSAVISTAASPFLVCQQSLCYPLRLVKFLSSSCIPAVHVTLS